MTATQIWTIGHSTRSIDDFTTVLAAYHIELVVDVRRFPGSRRQEFSDGLNELLMLSGGLRTAIMCAEVLWWRCHRRIISDVLLSLGVAVTHIRDESHSDVHKLIPPARIVDGSLTYSNE